MLHLTRPEDHQTVKELGTLPVFAEKTTTTTGDEVTFYQLLVKVPTLIDCR